MARKIKSKRKKLLVDSLFNINQVSTLQNGLKGIEIELKLAVPEVPDDIARKLTEFELNYKKQNKFLKSSFTEISTNRSHYFGTFDEERFVYIENKLGGHLKVKGNVVPYCLGISNEEFVLRRTESLKQIVRSEDKSVLLYFIKTIVNSCAPSTTHCVGMMYKEKATQYVLEQHSGRTYAVTLGVCRTEKREPLVQLEIEYAGHISMISDQKNIEDERNIVNDILSMADYFKRYNLTLTKLTKFNWLIGKV